MRGTPIVKYQYINKYIKAVAYVGVCLLFLVAGYLIGIVDVLYQQSQPVEKVNIKIELITLDEYEALIVPQWEFDIPEITTPIVVPIPPYRRDYQVEDGPTDGLIEANNSRFEYKFEDLDEEISCLAKNIYFEAKSESMIGRIAVGNVTINRVKSKHFPNTICTVVWEKRRHPITGKWVAQFSWTWDGKKDTPSNAKAWQESKLLASAMLAEGVLENLSDITDGADHYHALYVKPYWRKYMEFIKTIGAHRFYRSENLGV